MPQPLIRHLFVVPSARKLKQLAIKYLLEPWISKDKLESYMAFWAGLVYRVRRPLVIGITGSVGKSTTTEMIASVLSCPAAKHMVGQEHTIDNMNDTWGVSATLLRFEGFFEIPWDYPRRLAMLFRISCRALYALCGPYPKVLVLECGAGSTANFHRLVKIVQPTISVVTRIGAAHIEVYKTLSAVVLEKGILVRAAPPAGLVVLGQEHEYVSQLEEVARAPVVKVQGTGFALSQNITRAVCTHMGIPEKVVESVMRDFKAPGSRLERLEIAGLTVIDDSYNANPMSMKLGLDTLAETAGSERRRVAVLGFMAELGDESPRYHDEIGAYARCRADLLIGVGELARRYNPDYWFDTSEDCADRIESEVLPGDCLLVKGSHSARMGKVVVRLREIAERCRNVPSSD